MSTAPARGSPIAHVAFASCCGGGGRAHGCNRTTSFVSCLPQLPVAGGCAPCAAGCEHSGGRLHAEGARRCRARCLLQEEDCRPLAQLGREVVRDAPTLRSRGRVFSWVATSRTSVGYAGKTMSALLLRWDWRAATIARVPRVPGAGDRLRRDDVQVVCARVLRRVHYRSRCWSMATTIGRLRRCPWEALPSAIGIVRVPSA